MENRGELKKRFVTGAIPSQADFAQVFDSIPTIPDKSGDTTLFFGTTDSDSRAYVKNIRVIDSSDKCYILIGSNSATQDENMVSIIVSFGGDPYTSDGAFNIQYCILDEAQRQDLYDSIGAIHTNQDNAWLDHISTAGYEFTSLIKPNNNPTGPRVVIGTTSNKDDTTYMLYPIKQDNTWKAGYAIKILSTTVGSTRTSQGTLGDKSKISWDMSDSEVLSLVESAFNWKDLM